MDSKIGIIVQLSGVVLITLLTVFLRRSINTIALRHWAYAWLFLSSALLCLRLAFSYEQYSVQLFSLYFLTQYVFGFLLVAGCKSLDGNKDLPVRHELFVIPFILVAFGLPFLSDDFNLVFNSHSLIMAGFFAFATVAMWRVKPRTFGWNVMMVGLTLLTLDFLQYFVFFAAGQYIAIQTDHLAYNSVISLVLQTLLGFGMVIILLDQVLADARTAHDQLKRAHNKLEELAHVDPLTTALNRHAFYGYLKNTGDDEPVYGCVGFFDIDDLKKVNDTYGHAVGDMVIRSVVRAIREIIRAEDLIFRWGGDEFFVIMIGMDAEMGSMRMRRLEGALSDLAFEGVNGPLSIGVSHAFENFEDLNHLEATIKQADAGMYRQKQVRKGLNVEERYDIGTAVLTRETLVVD